MIKIKTFLSSQYDEIYQSFFLPSLLKAEPGIDLEKYTFNCGGDGQFGSIHFVNAQRIKWKKLMDWLAEGEPVVFCDADVIFLKPFISLLERECEDFEFAIQGVNFPGKEGLWGNVGIMYLKPTAAVRKFVSDVLEEAIMTDRWDEEIANDLMKKLSYRLLSMRYASNYGAVPDDALLYHAAPTYNKDPVPCLKQKIALLDGMKKRFL